MSEIRSTTYQCDHCGFTVRSGKGDGNLGWLHADDYSMGGDFPSVDLCPNCVSELKTWLRAGPQHAEERERIAKAESLLGSRKAERMALARHPAGNRKFPSPLGSHPLSDILPGSALDRGFDR